MKSNPKIIGINYRDNDFHTVVTAFLRNIQEEGVNEYENLTKEKIVKLYNLSVPGLYWLVQNKLEYSLDWKPETYLQIDVSQVYFDNEVKEYINDKNTFLNGEFAVLDTEVFKPYIYTT